MRPGPPLAPLALLLAAACAPEPPCGLRACDVRDAACQRMAAEAAACLRGVDPVDVPVAVVTRDAYVAAAENPPLTSDQIISFLFWNAGLAALGLGPTDDSVATDGAANAAQIGGFYSPTDKQITIIENGGAMDSLFWVGVLVHENVHALQDARFDLAQLAAAYDVDLDRALAFGAVLEGDATYVEDLAKSGFFGIGAGDVPWPSVFDQWQASARDEARVSARPVSLAWAFFDYPFGTAFVKGAVDVANGSRVDHLFAAPPSGTREVMAGFGAPEPTGALWAEDLGPDAVPVLGARFQYVGADRLGAWLFEVFLNRALQYDRDAANLAKSLRGDVLSVFIEQETLGAVAVWRLRLGPNDTTFAVDTAVRALPFARRDYAANDDVVIVAASDAATLADVPSFFEYQPIPPAPARQQPLAGPRGISCVRRAR